ncbi:MAG: hypothetical protein JWM59_1495 [Verrucomicrobiales bacterium]|nr:hypothetical protein [Verrucomicrobiales bacterium]
MRLRILNGKPWARVQDVMIHFNIPACAMAAFLLAGCSKQPAGGEGEAGAFTAQEDANAALGKNSPNADGGAGPTVAEIAASYDNGYIKVTDKAVYVNYELAIQCITVSEDQIQAARIVKGPHARSLIHIYMNESAFKAFPKKGSLYPVGSVIVKHKLLSGSGNAAVGVGGMVKRAAGFDPDHGDWEYFYFEDKSKIESGRLETCVQCHGKAVGTDYVFGTWFDADRVKSFFE